MPLLSRCILAYGFVLLIPEIFSLTQVTDVDLACQTHLSGWIGGFSMVAASIASSQRRRLLRVGGVLIALFFALTMTAIYAWSAALVWQSRRGSIVEGWTLSGLALASITLVWLIFRLRPRDGIASRGYAVLPTSISR